MSQIISLIQQKGGVGKTTLAVHLAFQIKSDRPDLTVCIADADPQNSATKWIERARARGDFSLNAVPVGRDGEGKHLKRELEAIEADVIVVDLLPAIASVSLRAALYSDMMLVPVGASLLDIEAAEEAVDVCREALELNAAKSYLVVPSRIRGGTSAGKEIREALSSFGPVSRSSIGLRIQFSDAATGGYGIDTYAPGSAGHKEIQTLTSEVLEALNLGEGHEHETCLAS